MGPLPFSGNPVSLIVTFIILGYEMKIGDGMHTQFCFRLPRGTFPDESYKFTGREDVNSVGIEKFPQDIWKKYILSFEFNNPNDGLSTGHVKTGRIVAHGEVRPNIRINPVRGRVHGSDALSGWYRVVLSSPILNGWSEFTKSFILYATDEQGNFIGTWEHNPFNENTQDCPPSDESKYMIIPCGGVSKYEAHVSNAVVFARNYSKDGNIWPTKYQKHWPIVPDYHEKSDLTFYWRFSMQDSNRNKYENIQFRLWIDPDHTYNVEGESFSFEKKELEKALVASSTIIEFFPESVPGAADALPTKRETLSCTDSARVLYGADAIYGGKDRYVNFHWAWYFNFFHGDVNQINSNAGQITDYLSGLIPIRNYQVDTRTGCTSSFYEGRCKETRCSISNQPDTDFERNAVDKTLVPQVHSTKTATCSCKNLYQWSIVFCVNEQHDTPLLYNNEKISFNDWWYEYQESVSGPRCAKTEAEVGAGNGTQVRVIRWNNRNQTIYRYGNQTVNITGISKLAIEDLYRRGVRQYAFGTVYYALRKGHAIIMLLLTFFFTPVSIFVSRYYKETFMSTRVLYAKVWFQIHIQLVLWMCALFATGLLLTIISRGFLGTSLVWWASVHRIIGWISFVFFVILLLSGGLRAMDDPWRSVTIGSHFVLGYIFYFLNGLAIFSSLYIPGSPSASAKHDESSNKSDVEASVDQIMFVLLGWMIFEFVIHVSMTFLIYSYDKWMQVQAPRKFIPPICGVPIPVLKENSESDASGEGIRLIAFCIYIGLSILVSFLGSLSILNNTAKPHFGFGPMSCTHEYDPSLKALHGNKDFGIYQFKMLDKFSEECKWED